MSGRFTTGQVHQTATAEWARGRLAIGTARGRGFRIAEKATSTEQHGVILADGVGMGKTWEALAGAALILEQMGGRRKDGARRVNVNRQRARVLVLCPPGLVTKWSREVRNKLGFRRHLERWEKGIPGRTFVLDTLTRPFELRRRADIEGLPKPRRAAERIELPAGVFVCNWNLLRGKTDGRTRLAKLPRQGWDVVIVDEAHHHEAREALRKLHLHTTGIRSILLLTATPFQLEPREFHDMFRAVLNSNHNQHKLLSRKPIVTYVKQLENYFKDAENPRPERELKQESEKALQQLVARTTQRGNGRKYFLVDADGDTKPLPKFDSLHESDLSQVLQDGIQGTEEFEAWYLGQRLRIAEDRTFVATGLRQLLSTPAQSRKRNAAIAPYSPKLEALGRWAERQFKDDLLAAARDGHPRKTLVFTTFVAGAKDDLINRLTLAFDTALREVSRLRVWKDLKRRAPVGLASLVRDIRSDYSPELRRIKAVNKLLEAIEGLGSDSHPLFPLFGSKKFRRLILDDLRERVKDLIELSGAVPADEWERKFHRSELRAHLARLEALGRLQVVDSYTGHDDQKDRDQTGEGFRSPLAPWVLVASNVGSEGIDLHTFAAHLVHFDIEWNPARMEQREGRTDRLGRKLKAPVNIHFLLVRHTYDERMLYQLVARQRWHSVLLGGAAKAMQVEPGQNELASIRVIETNSLMLDLRPKR